MHYHSTCFGCLTAEEQRIYRLSEGAQGGQTPGGTAFTTEELAQQHAESENAMSYMIGWAGHQQVVAPCKGKWCQPFTTNHQVEWQRQVTVD